MRKSGLTLAFLCLAGGALAQTYSVEPGLWEVEGDAMFAGMPLPIETTQCLTEEDAVFDAQTAIKSATDADCTFEHTNGGDFSVACAGEPAIRAAGTLDVGRRKIVMQATGTVTIEGAGDMPLSVNSTVRHIGACPAP